ncbi:MAG TPA: hypothetical protein VIJ42_02035 [Stellaceae bacterium]
MSGDTHANDLSGRPIGVAEAAARLGISTLRVRHRLRTGALKGFRDNRGHWQVRIDGGEPAGGDQPLNRDALADMLVEELLEAKDRIDDQDVAIKRLHALVARQQDLLDRTVARLEVTARPPTGGDGGKLKQTLDRALAMLEAAFTRQEELTARAERFRAMMDRSLALLEKVAPGTPMAPQADGRVAGTLDHAVDLADKALTRAETASHHAARLDGMLERALTIAEENSAGQQRAERRLTRHDELLERSLTLVEAAASRLVGDSAARRGVFSLFGRGARRPSDG